MLFSGQGKVFAAQRDANGNALAFRYLGNVSQLSVALATETAEHKESTSGNRLIDGRLTTQKSATTTMVLDEFTAENLALALFGLSATLAPDAVTDEAFPAALVAGDFVRLAQQKVSNVAIVDSAGAPVSLVEGTNYRIESADHGSIEILDPAALTQPFKADYDYAGGTNVAMFTQATPIRWLRFEGLNTAESNSPVLVELYRVSLDPVADLALLNDEYGQLSLTGSALYDAAKADDADLGAFGRIVLI